MGNCVSQGGQKEFLKSLRTSAVDSVLLDDHNSFLVYVRKRHKFMPGILFMSLRSFYNIFSDIEIISTL